MLKRHGKVAPASDDQLSLFDFARTYERTSIPVPDPVRPDGPEALAGVLPANGHATRNGEEANGSALGSAGDDAGRNGVAHPDAGVGARADAGAGAGGGVGIDPGE